MKTPITQREAVYSAVHSVSKEHGTEFVDGTSDANALPKEYRAEIISIVTEGLLDGSVSMKVNDGNQPKFDDAAKMKNYANGLVSNWFRKDTRLNGGQKHEIKNPGSRAGSGDATIREMRKLLKALTESGDTANAAIVQAEIDSKLAEVRKERATKVQINSELLPESLRSLLQ